MKKALLLLLSLSLLLTGNRLTAQNNVTKIVVLGSSTAVGTGPTNSSNAWVNLYRQYVKNINPSSEVINQAVGGYSTYQVMPSSFTSPADRPSPDVAHNITRAISLLPDVIIINLPTNDAASSYSVTEQMFNYSVILDSAAAKNIPVYIATTQPRNLSADLRQNLMDVRDSINKYLGERAIDFWTDIAATDGTINTIYDSGDGVHLNDAAHILLASRVEAENILSYGHDNTDYDTINIDLGGSTNLSGSGWNNLTSYNTTTTLTLTTSSGETTACTVWVNDAFTGVNETGTTTPASSTSFPSSATSDSFFGSVAAFNGVTEPTGGITISGLNTEIPYSFTFFASRTGVSDNRETAYIVAGSTKDTVYLNPVNNTSNIISVNGMTPAADGTITVTVGPGPNNTNASKFYFFGAVRIVYPKVIEYDKNGVIKIDLGNSTTTTSGNWNNLTSATGNETVADLINTEGNHTGFSIWVNDAFTGVNDYGTSTPDASLGLESTACSDSFFGSSVAWYSVTEPTGGLILSGLDVTTTYTFSFFASRPGAGDNREALYTVTGDNTGTATLNATDNLSSVATVEGIIPKSDGTITIKVTPGTNNTNSYKFYYLGAMTITYGENVVYDENGSINIDLGSPASVTSGEWNNLTAYAVNSSIGDLVNSSAHYTGIALTVHDAFTGINTAGTTSPDVALGLSSTVTSDSFFGNEGSHGGIYEPTAGITFSGLDLNTMYSFTIFASRDGVTDNRETQYKVTGSKDSTVYLNAANNTANTVRVLKMIPAADGTIKIDVAPGPNNSNATKYYFMGSVVIDYEKIVPVIVYDEDGFISIDCGSPTMVSSGNWNNLTAPKGGQVIELKNDEGNPTGISVSVTDAFTDANIVGTTAPDVSLGFESNATADSFFGNTGAHETIIEPTGGLTFTGLNVDSYYTFEIFASRAGVTDNRETKYTVTGISDTIVYLDAANNTSNVVYINNMKPSESGTITIVAAPGSKNTNSLGYFYLGVIRIEYGTSPLTAISEVKEENTESASLSIYPNPARENAAIDYYVPKDGNVKISIFNITGKEEAILVNARHSAGNYGISISQDNCSAIKNAGLYLVRIIVTSNNKTFLTTRKLLIVK